MTSLGGCTYEENHGHIHVADEYYLPDRAIAPFPGEPDTWVKPSQDIFGFGSFFYYLTKGFDPPQLSPREGKYPFIDGFLGSSIINRCWMMQFKTMKEVLDAVKGLVIEQGLTMVGDDDIAVDKSVAELEGYSCFTKTAG